MPHFRLSHFALSLSCLALTGCGDEALFQAPLRGGAAIPPLAAADSVITVVASLPYAEIAKIADPKIPNGVSLAGNGQVARLDIPYVDPGHVGSHQECVGGGWTKVCVNVPDVTAPSVGMRSQSADYNCNADFTKRSAVHIGQSGDDIRVEQDVHVTGKVGVGGSLAQLLSLNGKSFDVQVASKVDLSAGLDRQWCPVVRVAPVGRWASSASVEIVGRNCVDLSPLGKFCAGPVNLGLADVLNGEFDKHRDDLQHAAEDILPCDVLKAKISEQWHTFAIRVDRPAGDPLFLNIEPTSAGFAGIVAGSDRVKVVVRVGVRTVLSTSEQADANRVLPPLEPISAERGRLDVVLRAAADYGFLKRELLTALKDRTFKRDVDGNHVEVRIDDVDIYPSDGALAVGLKISAKLPGRWLDTTGWVYLSGNPVPARDGKAVAVRNLRFATVLDTTFWKVVQGVFATEILSALNRNAEFDLSGEIDEAAAQITAALRKADLRGLKITAGPTAVRLGSVHVGADTLILDAKAGMDFDTEITADILK